MESARRLSHRMVRNWHWAKTVCHSRHAIGQLTSWRRRYETGARERWQSSEVSFDGACRRESPLKRPYRECRRHSRVTEEPPSRDNPAKNGRASAVLSIKQDGKAFKPGVTPTTAVKAFPRTGGGQKEGGGGQERPPSTGWHPRWNKEEASQWAGKVDRTFHLRPPTEVRPPKTVEALLLLAPTLL